MDPSPSDGTPSPWDPLVRVAAAIAGGIGVLGFVALAGGAVLWARFDAAGLPTERALSVVPRTELIVIGAETLVPLAALVLVLIAATWIFVAARVVVTTSGLSTADERATRLERFSAASWPARAAIGLSGAGTFIYYLKFAPAPDFLDDLKAFVVCLVATIILERGWSILCKDNFGWFAALIGAVILVVGFALTYIETEQRPTVRPAAVVFNSTRRGVAGLFIAESDTQVYLAEVKPKDDNPDEGDEPTGRIIEIPRDEIRAVSIGSNQSLPQALSRVSSLRSELNALVPKRPSGISP